MSEEPWLVVGLGNPGPDYAATRHNAGFLVVDLLAARADARFAGHKGRADVASVRLAGRRCILAKPRSYMNLSGGPVAAVVSYFSVPVEQIVVVHDDLDLPFGSLRLKRGGGDGGHNGLRSVSQSLGSKEYLRARVGIGRPPGRMDPADYVLRAFSAAEAKDLGLHVDRAADAVEALLTEGLESAQSRYND